MDIMKPLILQYELIFIDYFETLDFAIRIDMFIDSV